MRRSLGLILTMLFLILAIPAHSEQAVDFDMPSSASALLMDAGSGKVIFEKNASEKTEVAGLKRLPALLTVCRAFDEGLIAGSTRVTVSSEAAAIRGTTAFLAPNETADAEPILKAAVMLTAGDAICALLKTVYPGESKALEAVNAVLDEVGAEKIGSSMGSDDLFSLFDIAAVGIALSRSEAYLKYSSVYLDTLRHENASATELTNPNRLVRHYSGCFGLATGSVGASVYAGAFIARRGTTSFLAVVAGMPDSASRFRLGSELLNYGFSAFRSVELAQKGEAMGSVPISGGTLRAVDAVTEKGVVSLIPLGDAKLYSEPLLPDKLFAPISEGDRIGTLLIKNSAGEIVSEAPLVAGTNVSKASLGDYFIGLLRAWLHCTLIV